MLLENIQQYASLVSCSAVLILNTIIYSWTSKNALLLTFDILTVYMILDTIIGYKHYIKHDRAIFIHHLIFIACFTMSKCTIHKYGYTDSMYNTAKWVMVNEISTFMNNIRIIMHKTPYAHICNIIFAIIFTTTRTISTVGSYYGLVGNDYYIYIAPMCMMICLLNVHWIILIYRKAKHLNLLNTSIEPWNRYTRLTVFILPCIAIDLYNFGHIHLCILTSCLCVSSVFYHYGFKKIKTIDIILCLMCITGYCLSITNIRMVLCATITILGILLTYITGHSYVYGYCISHMIFIIGSMVFIRVT